MTTLTTATGTDTATGRDTATGTPTTVTAMTVAPPPDPGSTARTRVRRLPDKAVTDRSALHGILDAGLVAHLAVADAGGRPDGPAHTAQPFALPVAYTR